MGEMAVNSEILLSICIPTYNRCKLLNKSLHSITECKIFQETNLCQIVISDNCSTDKTQDVCTKFVNKFPDKIKYIKHEKGIPADVNIFDCLKYGDGIYTKIQNDTLAFRPHMLEYILNLLNNEKKPDVIFFTNENKTDFEEFYICKDASDFNEKIEYFSTWVGGFCVKNNIINTLENPFRFSALKLQQADILTRLIANGHSSALIKSHVYDVLKSDKGASYNIARVFGNNFLEILKQNLKENNINRECYEKVKKSTLINHINPNFFNFTVKQNQKKSGYFKYMTEYRKNLYFYVEFTKFPLAYLNVLIQKILNFIKKNLYTINWRKLNKYNSTKISKEIDINKILVGENTQGTINAEFFSKDTFEFLYIGNNCKIGKNVKFVFKNESDIVIPDNSIIKDGELITNTAEKSYV